ncbi:esterase E4-like [Planococcus citri]|uniref:esterase E4-like n=1 Tax=Planococcus citri TaxID=170843 RepID=UPI0031FA39B0
MAHVSHISVFSHDRPPVDNTQGHSTEKFHAKTSEMTQMRNTAEQYIAWYTGASNMREKTVILEVNEGKIRGVRKQSAFSEVEYYSFLGIPYGQSTAGHARFKNPVKVKPWKGILDCTKEKHGCLQYSMRIKEITGSEDCLYNNIYIPKIPAKNDPPKAVIVCYHPGGLAHGSPDPWYYGSPEYIMHHDVVYVCVAFRLHVLGFLNLGLKECSGNQGLKDIILSLQWIKENISVFGGDPDNITLMGSGTGAGLVQELMIIPKTKNLFHKALLMGMYKTCPLHMAAEENASLALDIATRLGYAKKDEDDKKKLLSFYKKLDLEEVFAYRPDIFIQLNKATLFVTTPFVTTIDSGDDAVLPLSTREQQIESTARIPIMIGFCEREASMALTKIYQKNTKENFFKLIRSNYLGWGYDLNDGEIKLIRDQVEKFYCEGKTVENASLSTKCDILTDAALSDVYDTLINVISADLPSSVFVYKFNFVGNAFTINEYISSQFDEPLKGACHESDFNHCGPTQNTDGAIRPIL